MNKTSTRIFLHFAGLSAFISVIILCLNVSAILFIASETSERYPQNASYTLDCISESLSISDTIVTYNDTEIIGEGCWCILINGDGDIIWSYNKPDDIPSSYSLNDVARMTRWFLCDYPVYVKTIDAGLLVYGIPKNYVGKYFIEFSMKWFEGLPFRVLAVIVIDFFICALLTCLFGINLYKRLRLVTGAIMDLRLEKSVHIEQGGIFREVVSAINETSDSIERKNAALAKRDMARSNWIAGISHDLRTPLSMIMGYAEALEKSETLSDSQRHKAQVIKSSSIAIKKLIEDMNLISSLEYDMQPANKAPIKICALIREIVSTMANSGLIDMERYAISLELSCEAFSVQGDKSLIGRAIFNIINNSVTHNPSGCSINISASEKDGSVLVVISDNGSGVSEDVIKNITTLPRSAHGLGLPMAYRIFYVHGWKMHVRNNGGFEARITMH